MDRQRQTAKADAKAKRGRIADLAVYRDLRADSETALHAYEHPTADTRDPGPNADGAPVALARAGETVEIVLAETSLYAESGGQRADTGTIVGAGFELDVVDVQRPIPGLVAHTVTVRTGEVAVGDAATTIVDHAY